MADEAQDLAEKIKTRAKAEGISPATFGLRHFNNSRMYGRLLNGGSITLRTHEKLTAILASPPPAKAGKAARGAKSRVGDGRGE